MHKIKLWCLLLISQSIPPSGAMLMSDKLVEKSGSA